MQEGFQGQDNSEGNQSTGRQFTRGYLGNEVQKQQLLTRKYLTLIHITMHTSWSCNQISISGPLSRVKTHANPMKKTRDIVYSNTNVMFTESREFEYKWKKEGHQIWKERPLPSLVNTSNKMVFGLLTTKHHCLLFAKITASSTIVTKYMKHNSACTATVPFIFTKKNSK